MDRTSVAGICVLGVCLAGGAATDGYYWPNGWYHHLNPWESVRYWERDCVPGDGGVAYFMGTQAGTIVFTTDVALGGLDFGQVQLYTRDGAVYPTVRANGGSLTLTGDRAFVTRTAHGKTATRSAPSSAFRCAGRARTRSPSTAARAFSWNSPRRALRPWP